MLFERLVTHYVLRLMWHDPHRGTYFVGISLVSSLRSLQVCSALRDVRLPYPRLRIAFGAKLHTLELTQDVITFLNDTWSHRQPEGGP